MVLVHKVKASPMRSSLEIYDMASGQATPIWQTDDHIEAPNFMPGDDQLLVNGGGRLFVVPLNGGDPYRLDTGFADQCNNDHGISPDGTTILVSHKVEGLSTIFKLPIKAVNLSR